MIYLHSAIVCTSASQTVPAHSLSANTSLPSAIIAPKHILALNIKPKKVAYLISKNNKSSTIYGASLSLSLSDPTKNPQFFDFSTISISKYLRSFSFKN